MHYQMHQKEYPEFVKNFKQQQKKKTNQKNQRQTPSKADQHLD